MTISDSDITEIERLAAEATPIVISDEADQAFYNAARTAVPRLVEALREARERLASARDLHEKSMAMIHEAAGVRRNGLCGILGWIDDAKDAIAERESRQ